MKKLENIIRFAVIMTAVIIALSFAAPKDYFIYKLKFDTEKQAKSVLEQLEDNELIESIVTIGKVQNYYDSARMQPVYYDAWFVDIMTTDTVAELRKYIIKPYPESFIHGWSGDEDYIKIKPY